MDDKPKQMKTGTTTVGAIADGAVVLGADRKATMGYLVSSKDMPKILKIDDRLAMTTAGMVGDCQALAKYIKAELRIYAMNEGVTPSVRSAASLLSNMLYSRRFYPYMVQLVVGGYDRKPRLYSLDAAGGMTEEKEYFSTGSGSVMAFGVLEDSFKTGMPVEDTKKLVARAVRAATKRDIASGGNGISLVVIDSRSYKEISDEEVKKLLA